jgi:hypothetical protein
MRGLVLVSVVTLTGFGCLHPRSEPRGVADTRAGAPDVAAEGGIADPGTAGTMVARSGSSGTPGNEVLLIPRMVYVPYAPQSPTAPARAFAAAPSFYSPPTSPTITTIGPAPAPAATASAQGPDVEALNRRCAALESKITLLVEALNRARPQSATPASNPGPATVPVPTPALAPPPVPIPVPAPNSEDRPRK